MFLQIPKGLDGGNVGVYTFLEKLTPTKGTNKMPLSDMAIKNAEPKDKKYKLTDKDGLYLLVLPNGGKYFKYDYRFGGLKKEYSIGVYPKISLKEARLILIEAKALLSKGINPNEVKKAHKINIIKETEHTFQIIALEWFEKNKVKWTTKHAADKWHKLERDVFPFIGNSPIKTITAPTLLSAIRLIEARGAIETAHRTRNIVGEVYAYAIAAGFAERNIAIDLSGALSFKPPVIHRATITDPKEVGALMRAIDGYTGSFIAKAALKISPYIMLRPVEVASAEWADIDLIRKIWKIPAGKMKMNRVHIIPLPRQVIEIFETLQPLGGKYVFPSLRTKTRHMNASTVNAALRRMGYSGEEMTAHGFRAMAATLLYENGFTEDIVELQLAHVERNEIKAAYNHAQHLARRTEMLQWWADYLDELQKTT